MATSTDAGAFARLDRGKFFDGVRPLFGALAQSQVDGVNRLLDAFFLHALILDRRHLAYILATSFHETGRRMLPVREGFAVSDASARAAVARLLASGRISRNYALPNAAGRSFYGRGDVQLTHEDNYRKMGALLGLDLAGNPDLALLPDVSAQILIEGVTRGLSLKGDFTGRALEDFIAGSRCDYVGARRTVNGTDKAALIAGYAVTIEAALVAGGMPLTAARLPGALGKPVTVPVVAKADVEPPASNDNAPGFWSRLHAALSRKDV
ncbi:glycoside hydrolase family 19 protein [Methylobacterium haplocladii]|uniref:Chitinase n=1 Tax=Methylobacterium haplocladii TaxID=1176176 RepID=A0A512ISI8_9HYPH|nr:glycoside hydrolase family 19 protein [Methylobacterium haplocladii]GEP00609.1 chitinase [Methylobacterium haplocladii]GJD85523.1 hypothetical protein HPGCJGGD_3412 [Methylobacterium haplocladii]GLS57757.1 chitinase [Methylobacterium haplocladii]